MTTTILAGIIFAAIVIQLGIFLLYGFFKANRNLSHTLTKNDHIPVTHDSPINLPPDAKSVSNWIEFEVQRREFENKDHSICSYYLVPVDGKPLPVFSPGQYLTFKILIDDPVTQKQKPVIRCYSLSDTPCPDYYRVSIKRVSPPANHPELPEGKASSHFHQSIHAGSKLLIKPPSGQFHLNTEEKLPVVLIGGGIGITPMVSILNTLLQQKEKREIWLFYAVQNSQSHIMKTHLAALAERNENFHLYVCYSSPEAEDQLGVDYHHQGRIDIPLLRHTLQMTRYQFYICGPSAMMQSMVSGLQDWGIPDKDIYYESFGPSSIKRTQKTTQPAPDSISASITFSKSNKTVNWDSSYDSLLEFAEDHHIEIESGCRSGNCGSCQTQVQSGELDLTQSPDFDVPPGYCLMCISTPRGNLILDA